MKTLMLVLAVSYSSICLSSPVTAEERAVIAKSRDLVRLHHKMTMKEFHNFQSAYHAAILVRLLKGNLFVFGPPGGAKSGFIHHMMDFESDPRFEIQMNEMTSEQALVGAQDFDAGRKGEFKINTKGSLVEYKIGLIDEIDKANPATLGSMFAILNERQVPVGGHVVKAKTETVYSTSNMNYAKLYAIFYAKGREESAEALFDRFHISVFVYNWLSKKDQLERDKNMECWPFECEQDGTEQSEPEFLDWKTLRGVTTKLFRHDADFNAVLIDLVDSVRTRYIEKSMADKKNRSRVSPYFPSARVSERLRTKIAQVIYYSALVDFLLSPLADDLDSLNEPLVLDPLSVWRCWTILTTVTPGETLLELKTDNDQKSVNMLFPQTLSNVKKNDAVEELFFSDLLIEQEIFGDELKKAIKAYYQAKVAEAKASGTPQVLAEGFEHKLYLARFNDVTASQE